MPPPKSKTRKAIAHAERAGRTLIMVLIFGTPALAADPAGYPEHVQAYDPREVAMLPRYCIHTQGFRDHVPGGNNPMEIERWFDRLGPTYNAMHHYCVGLMKTNRAMLARTQRYRLFYLKDAVGEFDYVLERAPPDFVLLPEILTKKGENLIRLGQNAIAVQQLEHAIEIKPDYWPPYAALSDFYKQKGDMSKAREILENGLSLSPTASGLKNRLSQLDEGKHNRKTLQ